MSVLHLSHDPRRRSHLIFRGRQLRQAKLGVLRDFAAGALVRLASIAGSALAGPDPCSDSVEEGKEAGEVAVKLPTLSRSML